MSVQAIKIATAAHDLLVAHFGPRFKTYRKTPMLQVSSGDLPLLGVYIMREQGTAAGDANHAEPDFQTTLTLGEIGRASCRERVWRCV